MEITNLGSFGISASLALIIAWILIKFMSTRGYEIKLRSCIVPVLFLTMVVWMIFLFLTPKITEIYGEPGNSKEETKYALFSYGGYPVNFGKEYLNNRTDRSLVVYPVDYGTGGLENDPYEIKIVEPKSFEEISHSPSYFFYEPNSIIVEGRQKSKRVWVVDWLDKYRD